MAETITVDGARLHAGAAAARGWVAQLEASPAGGSARAALAAAEHDVTGSRAAPALAQLARGLDAVVGQVVTSLHGLASSLDCAAEAFHQVDVIAAGAAEQLGDPTSGQVRL